MNFEKFATSINCIDGRIQIPVSNWIKQKYFVDYVDVISHPGSDKVIGEKIIEGIAEIKSKVLVSINAHNSKLIVISGHHDCAGNPVSKEMHMTQIKKSINLIKSWDFPVTVIGIWVNDKWEIEEIQE
ncbi:MAG TPA: carbonic anhydrase [Nitrosopumilus sp.]|jgi:hypothetical protein|nr:carbonic anhydrase [Nitrosopumilus sp.]HJO31078.1 carbonic anhydrase [Nitrosopumilus sp.]|tara:strand:+ start:5347 stop:5730 length:384 start_codon:yes stop_codon:yes gene_type:complete